MRARYSFVTFLLTILLSSVLFPAYSSVIGDDVTGFRKPWVSIPPRDSVVTSDSLGSMNSAYSINSPLLKSAVVSPISAAAGQVSGGTAAGLVQGQSFGEAFKASFDGVVKSMAVGGALGMISTVAVSYANKINPFTGERQYTFKSVGAKRLPTNLKKLSDSYINKNGINAHDIKKEYLGKNAIISHFDVYQSQSG